MFFEFSGIPNFISSSTRNDSYVKRLEAKLKEKDETIKKLAQENQQLQADINRFKQSISNDKGILIPFIDRAKTELVKK